MNKLNVLIATIPGMIDQESLSPIQDIANVEYHEAKQIDQEDLALRCKDIDVLMLNYDIVGKLNTSFLEHKNIKALKSISTDITGMDWAQPKLAQKLGITLQNIPHYSTESVAETIVTEVLMHARQRPRYIFEIANNIEAECWQGINLKNRRASIIGLGSIGSRVYTILECLGMDVYGWSRSKKDGYNMVDIQTCFEGSDVICICASTVFEGDQKNIGMINEQLLQLCKNSIIVNLAGEFLVDNKAMLNALNHGNVIGYSVERSKTTIKEGFSKYPNVNLPPKNSWKSQESLDKLKEIWISNTLSSLQGHPNNIYVE